MEPFKIKFVSNYNYLGVLGLMMMNDEMNKKEQAMPFKQDF